MCGVCKTVNNTYSLNKQRAVVLVTLCLDRILESESVFIVCSHSS